MSSDGTGVRGLDTPDHILTNPFVEEALDKASDKGVNFLYVELRGSNSK